MKKRLTGFLLPLMVLIVSGCAPQPGGVITPPSSTPPPPPISGSLVPTTAPPKTRTPTSSPPASQPTNTPTASWTVTPYAPPGALVAHIEIIPEMIWGQANGALLLGEFASGMVLLDLSTGTKIPVAPLEPSWNVYCFYLAPNRLQIACSAHHSEIASKTLILDNRGQIMQEVPWKDAWKSLVGWLNNEEIMYLAVPPPDYAPYQNLPTTLFNLVAEEETILLPDYPNISSFEPFGMQGPLAFTGASYSPNLNLVVYKSWDGAQKQTGVVLWDREHNREVVRIPDSYSSTYPQWHPAGDRVVVVGSENYPESEEGKPGLLKPIDEELFILSVLEQSRQVTHLGELFDNTTRIRSLGWSPDGQRIAFDLRVDSSECDDGCIGILEVETGLIELVNFPNYRTALPLDPTYSLVWSPDSRQLVLEVISGETNEHAIIVYDVERKVAFQVATQARIEGWLIYP
jgi:hypothetical protein